MNKFSKVLAATGLVAMSLGLVACQTATAPTEDPGVVLQKGLTKLMEVSSNSYSVNLQGDLKGPAGEEPEKVTFKLAASGSMEAKDAMEPKFNLSIKGDMMADADGGNLEAAFRMNKEAIYLSLMSLEGKGEVTIPEEIKAELVGKWWTMPIPPEALEELAKSVPTSDTENMTEDQKKMKELLDQTKFFKDVVYKGSENVSGEPSHHYTAVLDKDAFATFVAKAAELQGETVSQAEIDEMKAGMEMFDFSGDFYVGQNSGILNKVKGVFTLKATADGDSPSGTVTVEATAADFNKPVTVEVPADAQPIPMEMLGALPL